MGVLSLEIYLPSLGIFTNNGTNQCARCFFHLRNLIKRTKKMSNFDCAITSDHRPSIRQLFDFLRNHPIFHTLAEWNGLHLWSCLGALSFLCASRKHIAIFSAAVYNGNLDNDFNSIQSSMNVNTCLRSPVICMPLADAHKLLIAHGFDFNALHCRTNDLHLWCTYFAFASGLNSINFNLDSRMWLPLLNCFEGVVIKPIKRTGECCAYNKRENTFFRTDFGTFHRNYSTNERVTHSLSVMVAPRHGLVVNQLGCIRKLSRLKKTRRKYSHTTHRWSLLGKSEVTHYAMWKRRNLFWYCSECRRCSVYFGVGQPSSE